MQFGIWKSKRLDDTDGKSLVSCAVCVFGPRCTLWIPSATASGGVVEFTYDEDSSAWVKSTTVTDLSGAKRVFSPANLRCTSDNVGYAQLIAYYMAERYTLRYTGGLVPDVCGILSRRCGIFTSPTSSTAAAKLRVLYEVMPMALLVENAGGSACDEHGTRILDMKVTGFDQRSGLVCGEKNEVDRYIELVCSSTTNKK